LTVPLFRSPAPGRRGFQPVRREGFRRRLFLPLTAARRAVRRHRRPAQPPCPPPIAPHWRPYPLL